MCQHLTRHAFACFSGVWRQLRPSNQGGAIPDSPTLHFIAFIKNLCQFIDLSGEKNTTFEFKINESRKWVIFSLFGK